MKNINLQLCQIFYGRGKDGYGILGASPSGRQFSDSVAALCRAVGSPDRPGDVRPFLISKREHGYVIMVRACRDEDSSGRATLFSHALVAKEDELASAGLDAFVLAERGVFVSSLPDGNVNDLPFPSSVSRSVNPCSLDVRFPAFIAADHPLDADIRRVLGRETLSRNWATYSYNPLQGFDICVYSSYGASPTNGNRYVFEGGCFVAVLDSRLSSQTSRISTPVHIKELSFVFKVSLLVNFVLVAVLAVLLVIRNENDSEETPQTNQKTQPNLPKTESVHEMTKEEAFKKWGVEWGNAYLQELRSLFEKQLGDNQHVSDFDAAMLKIDPYYIDYKNSQATPPTPQTMMIYKTLKTYISFVEENIIKQQTQERK